MCNALYGYNPRCGVKLQSISQDEGLSLVAELRQMAALPTGPNPGALKRAREIRFQLAGQAWIKPHVSAKLDTAFAELEVLLSTKRWQEYVGGADAVRKAFKSACARVSAGISSIAV